MAGSRSGLSKSKASLSSSFRVRPSVVPGRPSWKTAVRLAVEVAAFSGGDQDQSGLRGGGLHGGDERGFQFSGHALGILFEIVQSF